MRPVWVSAGASLELEGPEEGGSRRQLTSIGKTSLVQQYVAPPTYQESYYPTIESTSHKIVQYGGEDYECEIIDSAGQVSSEYHARRLAMPCHRMS